LSLLKLQGFLCAAESGKKQTAGVTLQKRRTTTEPSWCRPDTVTDFSYRNDQNTQNVLTRREKMLQPQFKPHSIQQVLLRLFQVIPGRSPYGSWDPGRCLRCAVVGNSGNLRGAGYGATIDGHNYVMSTYAPVKQFLRVDKDKVQIFNPAFFKYIHDHWTRHHGRYPSTGMLVLFFALHVCDEVSERVWFRRRQPGKLAPLLGAEPLLRRVQEDRRPRRGLRSPDHPAAGQGRQNHRIPWEINQQVIPCI
ncbi:CMP-N-acetylneuraminate-beta-galactosamide-alpha-2, partial [Nibea albiflora]